MSWSGTRLGSRAAPRVAGCGKSHVSRFTKRMKTFVLFQEYSALWCIRFGTTGNPQHRPEARPATRQHAFRHDRKPVPLIEPQIVRVPCFQIARKLVRIGVCEHGLHQGATDPPALLRRRKRLVNAAIHALRARVERTFAWEDKFKRVLLRFEYHQRRHYGMKLMAYTLMNLRAFCGT